MSTTGDLPTLYEYYTTGGINAGLQPHNTSFTLNEKKITVYSGALHYFRVHPEHWRDRLRKMRAAGLNAVETYMPWNLHEPESGSFDFGAGATDFQEFLNVEKFLRIAKEEDLLVILRPGPYICAEWEFGGLPSWLLRTERVKLRTSDESFIRCVERYFNVALKTLSAHQFTRGGPIVAFQIENEYGNTKRADEPVDSEYLERLKTIYLANDVVELLFTSDTPSNGNYGSLPGVLYTANFQRDCAKELDLLTKKYRPGEPAFVMEYWTGWFDHWTENHHLRSNEDFSKVLQDILNYPASVNMYMFHGGTSWGFLNGANVADSSTDNSRILHNTTSYDYDAPLSEAGDYTDKYFTVKELLAKHTVVKTKLPDAPALQHRVKFPDVEITEELDFVTDVLAQAPQVIESVQVQAMERLPINNGNGQSYGYVIYRKDDVNISGNSVLKIGGHVCDTVTVSIDGKLVSKITRSTDDLDGFGYWKLKDSTLDIGTESRTGASLVLVVENWGRNNFGKLEQFNQYKGLWQGDVTIDGETLTNWRIYPIEFKKSWTNGLTGWRRASFTTDGPKLYRGILRVDKDGLGRDTFIDMRDWMKGIVIVNGFVLARYFVFGPQQTAYLPAPFLREGENEIIVFEHFKAAKAVKFSDKAIFNTVTSSEKS